ncbi:unnamed protein product [Orchesella dallaii]|uniref:Uncharacterized protein n=1 Tax=Orchesella dallaii TaxID=48710 RepID=A0ABP1R061_9HEXA
MYYCVSVASTMVSSLFHWFLTVQLITFPKYVCSFELQSLVSKIVSTSPEHFVFYFFAVEHLSQGPDNKVSLAYCLNFPTLTSCPQQLTFSGPLAHGTNPNNMVGSITLKRTTTKFSLKRFDIVITPTCTPFYNTSNENVAPNVQRRHGFSGWTLVDDYGLYRFTLLFSFPSTLFVLIKNCPSERYRRVALQNEPLLPVILELKSLSNVDYSNMKIVTLRKEFSFEKGLVNRKNQKDSYMDPTILHKYAYRNAHGMNLHLAYYPSPYSTYERNHPDSTEDCLTLASQLLPICSPEIMIVLTVGKETHNMSVFLYDLISTANNRNDLSKYYARLHTELNPVSPPTVLQLANYMDLFNSFKHLFGDEWVPENTITLLHSIKFDSLKLIYCKNDQAGNLRQNINFKLWVHVFDNSIWMIITVWSFVVLLAALKNRDFETWIVELVQQLVVLRDSSVETFKKCCCFILLFTGMMLRGYYENEITSLITAPPPPIVYPSLGGILNDGYKILWSPYIRSVKLQIMLPKTVPPSEILHHEFLTYGISSVNNSLHQIKDHNNSDYYDEHVLNYFGKFSAKRRKLAFVSLSSSAELQKAVVKAEVLEHTKELKLKGVTDCFIVEKDFYHMMRVYQIGLLSRHWFKQSVSRIQNSGLPSLWESWAIYGEKLRSKIVLAPRHYSRSEITIDDIKILKFLAPFVAWFCLSFLCCVVFGIETVNIRGRVTALKG